jgi:hypothetical protein
VAPSALVAGAPAPEAFVTRVADFLARGALEVRQDGRRLHRTPFRSLVPNRSIRLPGHWVADVEYGGGPVVLSAVTRASSSNGVAP